MAHMQDELLVELECPVCTNYMIPPIKQCATGHSICNVCQAKLTNCPLCLEKFLETRSFNLEGLARKLHFPCVNKSHGCPIKLKLDDKDAHEQVCNYRGFSCGFDNCSWTGKYDEISAHWESKKMTTKPYTDNNVCHTRIKTDSTFVNLVKAHNKLFWFRCKTTTDAIHWVVQYIGKDYDREKFYYQIEVFKVNENRKKIMVGDYCLSPDVSKSQMFTDNNSSFIPLSLLKRYLADDGMLSYHIRVKFGFEKKDTASGGPSVNEKKKTQDNKNPNPNKNSNNKKPDNPRNRPKKNEKKGSDEKKSGGDKKSNNDLIFF